MYRHLQVMVFYGENNVKRDKDLFSNFLKGCNVRKPFLLWITFIDQNLMKEDQKCGGPL